MEQKMYMKGRLIFDPPNMTKKHTNQGVWKRNALVLLNDDMAEYYSWFIKRRFNLALNRPLRGAHLTVISDKMGLDEWNSYKEMFNKKEIKFSFDPSEIRTDGDTWWLAHVECVDGDNIRAAMRLGDPYYGYHITIGTVPKEAFVRHEHSKYIHRQILRFGL